MGLRRVLSEATDEVGLAGPRLEICVQSAECRWRFMENTREWTRLMHCPWSTKFSRGRRASLSVVLSLPWTSWHWLHCKSLHIAPAAFSFKPSFPLASQVFFQGWQGQHNNILYFDLKAKYEMEFESWKKFCRSHFKSTQHLQLSIFFIVMSNEYLVFSMNIAASFTNYDPWLLWSFLRLCN